MKRQILGIRLTAMTQDESFQFHTAIYEYYKECASTNFSVPEENYRVAIEEFDVALKQVRKSNKTEKLAELDSIRDRLYVDFVKTNKTAMCHYDHDIADAATTIAIVIKNYKNAAKASYPAGTSILHNLCQDLESTTYAPLIEKLGFTEWVVKMKKANKDFNDMFDERSDIQSALIVDLAREARKEVERCYNILIFVSDADLLLPFSMLHAYLARINERIAYYRKLIAERSTRNAKKRRKNDPNNNKPEDNKPDDDDNNDDGPIEI